MKKFICSYCGTTLQAKDEDIVVKCPICMTDNDLTRKEKDAFDTSRPYIFASYAHKDDHAVLPIVQGMQNSGFRVWYDKGIAVGEDWPTIIESKVKGCNTFVVFMSDNTIASKNCRNEINLALKYNKKILVLEMHPGIKYASGMELQLDTRQKLFVYKYSSIAALLQELHNAAILSECKDITKATGTARVAKPDVQPTQKTTVTTIRKKRSKMPVVIAAVAAIALVVAGVFVLPRVLGDEVDQPVNGDSEKQTVADANYSRSDKKQIESIIEEAESMVAENNYSAALAKVEEGLSTYADSEQLRQKADDYALVLYNEKKTKTLADAATLAESENYEQAMELIQNEDPKGDDAEYQTALESYRQMHFAAVKKQAVSQAEEQAGQKKFLEAIATIGQAVKTVGEDAELTAKKEAYTKAYAEDISAQVDALLAESKIDNAKTLLQNANKQVPNNSIIKARISELDSYKTVSLSTLTPINGSFAWNEGIPEDPFDSDYSSVKNYTIYHGNYCSNEYSTYAEYKIDGKYDLLQFNISPYSDYGENALSLVKVYVDGVLHYVSPAISQKFGLLKTEVDISGATYLKIVIDKGDYGCVLLSDMTLQKLPSYESKYDSNVTSLATLSALNGGFSWDSGFPRNVMGDSYTDIANYAIYHGNYCSSKYEMYSEYYLAGKYESFSVDIAPYSDFGSGGTSCVKIYVDDVLVHTTNVQQKSAKVNTGSIDVSNANYLKIVVEKAQYGCVILSDALLVNASEATQ